MDGSGPNRRPWAAPARCSVDITVPGSTTAVPASGSIETTWFRWREKSSTTPGPTALPATDVPAPRAVTGMDSSRSTSRPRSTSRELRGKATTSGTTR